MGLPVAAAVLVEATSHRLRYLVTANGSQASVFIPNAGGPTPDLRTDIDSVDINSPLRVLINTPVTSVAEARRLFAGEGGPLPPAPGPLTSPSIANVWRAHMYTTARNGAFAFGVDAQFIGTAPVIVIFQPLVGGAEAYIDLIASHTLTQ